MHFYQYLKEWLKNPQCSVSCCMALLLPLNDMQGDITDQVAESNVLGKQMDVGQVDMSAVTSSIRSQGAGEISRAAKLDGIGTKPECSSNRCHRETQTKLCVVLMASTVWQVEEKWSAEKERT